ncbi:MAG TPA: PQQ-dependent sugar dehydrogenase [Mycobacteriales bacterium]|nr:PQQ-dependent sugar dehydrogenase [Mycobacteriales bacterium]
MARPDRPFITTVAAAVVTMLTGIMLLSGCGYGSANAAPTWVPKPDTLPPVGGPDPQLSTQPEPGQGGGGRQGTGAPGQPGQAGDPNVVASKLRAPWGLATLPDGTALVGERTTGRILRVAPDRSVPPQEVMRIAGLDGGGDGGLLGLAISPSYREDRLVFGYLTTATDNRVVRFELGGIPTPIITGIPKGHTGNGGRIEFGPDDLLYVGTGDGDKPALAQAHSSLAGKILRVDQFGRPARNNPDPSSAVYSTGHGNVSGLCWNDDKELFAVENTGPTAELNRIRAGTNHGWPAVRGKAHQPDYVDPAQTFEANTAPIGGCAIIGFGLFATSLTGQKLLAITLDGTGSPGAVDPLLNHVYGRLRTVEAASDGALWLTTANHDAEGKAIPDDDRVIRILPPPDSTTSPV